MTNKLNKLLVPKLNELLLPETMLPEQPENNRAGEVSNGITPLLKRQVRSVDDLQPLLGHIGKSLLEAYKHSKRDYTTKEGKPDWDKLLGNDGHDLVNIGLEKLLGGDKHDLVKHGLDQLLGGDGHDLVKHGLDKLLGGDGHDLRKHGLDQLLGGDGHDLKKHGLQLLGGDGHDLEKHGLQLLGGDGHDLEKHGLQLLGGDDHDLKPHGNLIGGDDHDLKPHGNLIGGDDHDLKPHGNMIGGDDHDLKPHGNLIGGDDHDLKPHGNLIGGDDHDLKPHGNLIGGDDHDLKPHGKLIGGDDHDLKPHGKLIGGDGHDMKKHHGLFGGDGDEKCHYGHFKEFKTKHGKSYGSDDEDNKRFAIFCNNMAFARKLNESDLGTATYGATKFADLTRDEFRQQYLSKKNWADIPNHSAHNMWRAKIPRTKPPTAFDWRDHGAVTPVKNQGSCGSCWAFSTTGNIEGQWKIQKGNLVSLSEQELVDCDKLDEGCNGGLPSNAYMSIMKLGGMETEGEYEYKGEDEKCIFNKSEVAVKINGAVNISKNEDEMASWLFVNGPISIGINANAMQFYFGGISHPWKIFCNPAHLDHGVLIVGYGVEDKEPYWIVKNSWGPNWGEKGYYRVYRGGGVCGLNKMCTSAVVN